MAPLVRRLEGSLAERLESCERIGRGGGHSRAGERDFERERAIEKLVGWKETEFPAWTPASADAAHRFKALAVWMPLLRAFGDEGPGRVAGTKVGCKEQDRSREERNTEGDQVRPVSAFGGFFPN